jgi:hypothetical protein
VCVSLKLRHDNAWLGCLVSLLMVDFAQLEHMNMGMCLFPQASRTRMEIEHMCAYILLHTRGETSLMSGPGVHVCMYVHGY